MLQKLVVVLCVICLIVPGASFAQDDPALTCDGGENDALDAAQAAYKNDTLDRAYELVRIAVQVCGSGTEVNFARYEMALNLQTRIELDMQSVPVEMPSAPVPFTLTNQMDYAICQIVGIPPGQTEDSDYWAVSSARINPTETQTINFDPGIYILALFDCDSEVAFFGYGMDLFEPLTLTLDEKFVGDVELVSTMLDIGNLLQEQGEANQAFINFLGALDVSQKIGDEWTASKILNKTAEINRDNGQYALALSQNEQALAYFRKANDFDDIGETLIDIGQMHYLMGAYAASLAPYQEALAMMRNLNNTSRELDVLNYMGQSCALLGRLPMALDYYNDALVIAQALPDPVKESALLNNIGSVNFLQGDYERALENFLPSLQLKITHNDQEGMGTTLNNIGLVYQNQGDYTQALEYYTQALEWRRANTDPRGAAITLSNIGTIYVELGELDRALNEYFFPALTIQTDLPDPAGQGKTLNNIGLVYDAQGRYEEALSHYEQALDLADPLNKGEVLSNIGSIYENWGQYDRALDRYEQALVIQQGIGDWPGQSITLNNMGSIRSRQGRFIQALDLFEQALDIQRAIGDISGEAVTLNNIGAVYDDMGNYAEALARYDQALEIDRQTGNRISEIQTLNNMGTIYGAQGRYALALLHLNNALKMAQEIGNLPNEMIVHSNIGVLYDLQNQYGLAMEQFNAALTIAQQIGSLATEGTLYNNMSLIAMKQNQMDEAIRLAEQALAIARQLGDRAEQATNLANLGSLRFTMLDHDAALAALTEALELARAVGDPEVEATIRNTMGSIMADQGQVTESVETHTEALAIQERIGDQIGRTVSLNSRALSYELLGQTELAISDYEAAVVIIEDVLRDAAVDSLITNLSRQFHNTWPYQRLAVLLAQQGDIARAFQYAERGRAILVRADLATDTINFREGLDETLLEREKLLKLDLNDKQALLDTLNTDDDASDDSIIAAIEAVDLARQAYEDHLLVMQTQGGYLARQLAQDPVAPENVQAILPEDTTLLVYMIGYPDSVVFLITVSSITSVELDVDAEVLDELIDTFNSGRIARDDVLRDVHEAVFAPLAEYLTPSSHLIIAADGPLNYVPFAALPNADGRLVIEDFTISMIPSASTLVLLHNRQPTGAATSAGLVLSQSDAPGFDPLPNSFREALVVAQLLEVDAIRNASETTLRTQVAGSSVLFISAHAKLDGDAPLYSTIHLGQDDLNDGRFQVREIYEIDLTKSTELVVLSGCETASGGDGEDYGLLTRAFFSAGAPRVVASLWSVSDESTAALMQAFIAERPNHATDAAALQAAMLSTRQDYAEPYYWASFVLTGLP